MIIVIIIIITIIIIIIVDMNIGIALETEGKELNRSILFQGVEMAISRPSLVPRVTASI